MPLYPWGEMLRVAPMVSASPLVARVRLLLAVAALSFVTPSAGALAAHGRLISPSCVQALSADETPVRLDVPGMPELRHVTEAEIPALVSGLQGEFGYGANDDFFADLPSKYAALGAIAHLPLGQRTDEYWVIVFPDGQVAGGIGLARLPGHALGHEWWLEWFFLSPRLRGHKLGEQLIAFIENRARAKGAATLSLYTSTAPQEAAANFLYERRGYGVYHTAPDTLVDGTPILNLYRARTL